jgi:hypothetical protein
MPDGIVVVPLLIGLVYLGLIVYVLLLATRLVNAVERIARSLDTRSQAAE